MKIATSPPTPHRPSAQSPLEQMWQGDLAPSVMSLSRDNKRELRGYKVCGECGTKFRIGALCKCAPTESVRTNRSKQNG